MKSLVQRSPLPGFGLSFGITVVYLGLVILLPLSGLLAAGLGMTPAIFWRTLTHPPVVAAFKLTFGASFLAASINAVFGFIVAWVLVRYKFYGRRFVDAMVDLPFALPTAVSGLALAEIYSPHGWIGSRLPFRVENSQLGVLVALTFIGLPFVVRAMQPAIMDIEGELEEVAASLGASRWQTFWKVIFPTVLPALITGFAMAFARALGEYGSVIFISGDRFLETQIVSSVIVTELLSGDDRGEMIAASIAITMLFASFALMFIINLLQLWSKRTG